LEGGRNRATSAEWQVSVKFLKNVNQDIAATTMQVAELNPYCVSSQDSFHTDIFSNAPLIGGTKVVFPLFSVRTEQNENIEIRWLEDNFFKAHKTVRVPYNERIGTFVSPTMSGQSRTSHNAEWEIRIKFLKYEFNNGIIVAPPTSEDKPAAVRVNRERPRTRTTRSGQHTSHASDHDEELPDDLSEYSDGVQDEYSKHDSDDTDVESEHNMEDEEEQEELAHQAVLAALRADHNKQIQVLRKQAEYKAEQVRQQADQRRAVDNKKKIAEDKIPAALAARLAKQKSERQAKEEALKQKNDAARRALESKQSNARASMDKHRRDEAARLARHAVNGPRRDEEIKNLRRKQDEDVRPFNDPQGAPAHRSRQRDTKQAEQKFRDDRLRGKTPAEVAEILRREKALPTDELDDPVPLLVDTTPVSPVKPDPASQPLRRSPVKPSRPPPPVPDPVVSHAGRPASHQPPKSKYDPHHTGPRQASTKPQSSEQNRQVKARWETAKKSYAAAAAKLQIVHLPKQRLITTKRTASQR